MNLSQLKSFKLKFVHVSKCWRGDRNLNVFILNPGCNHKYLYIDTYHFSFLKCAGIKTK